ncbi:hypothetical protein MIDIC_270005 [Alphaproteobacteria bacterium]
MHQLSAYSLNHSIKLTPYLILSGEYLVLHQRPAPAIMLHQTPFLNER